MNYTYINVIKCYNNRYNSFSAGFTHNNQKGKSNKNQMFSFQWALALRK